MRERNGRRQKGASTEGGGSEVGESFIVPAFSDTYAGNLILEPMKRSPLWLYVTLVAVILVIVNWVAWHTGGAPRFAKVEDFSIGFVLGMLALYIAMHVYRDKRW
jgi:hypothetical protein